MISPDSSGIHTCAQCGLPMRPTSGRERNSALLTRFCCYGCYVTSRITAAKGEEGSAALILARLALAGFLAMNVMTFSWALYGETIPLLFPVEPGSRRTIEFLLFSLSLPVFLLIGVPYLRSAVEQFRALKPGVDSLIAVGTVSAFLLSARSTFTGSGGVYYDTATMVLVLVTFGRYLEANARLKSFAVLRALASQAPGLARVITGKEERLTAPANLTEGSRVRVLPGETIPVDGIVEDGTTTVDESLLTGESRAILKSAGSRVMGGCRNHDGSIIVKATAAGEGMVMSHLVALMKEVQLTRLPIQASTDRFSRLFTPAVILIAFGTLAFWAAESGIEAGLLNGLSVLLIACPCALGIGATLAASVGYVRCVQNGVLVRSLAVLERLGKVRRVFFDKTGTLSEGALRVVHAVQTASKTFGRREMLDMVASVEAGSRHPVGNALVAYARESGAKILPTSGVHLVPGQGIKGIVRLENGRGVLVDVSKNTPEEDAYKGFHEECAISCQSSSYVSFDNVVSWYFVLSDQVRKGAKEAVEELARRGIASTILSGDRQRTVSQISNHLGIADARGDLLPADKIRMIEEARHAGVVAMVGDGINDAPALASADVGVALRGGTDVSRQAADITIMDEDLRKIPWAISFSRRVLRTIHWNLVWAFVYNTGGIILAVLGVLQPVFAAVAMVGSSVLIIVNSSRLAAPKRQMGNVFRATAGGFRQGTE